MAKHKLTVIDGRPILYSEAATEGGFAVTSPTDPALNTQGEPVEACIANGRDGTETVVAGQSKLAMLARRQRGRSLGPVT